MKRITIALTLIGCLLGGGVSVFMAPWAFAASVPSHGLRADYFREATLTTLAISRYDANVNFNWQGGAPAAGVPSDRFSARWTGRVVPRFSEQYTFRVLADDGARLWINGKLAVDGWSKAYGGVNSAPITLKAGQPYALKLEYREQTGSAAIKLQWSSRSQALQVIPQSQLLPPAASAPAPTPIVPEPTAVPPASGTPKLLFGIGTEASGAISTQLATQAPVHMLTSWYNSPNDLSWMSGWKTGLVPRAYNAGYALHLVVFSNGPETTFASKYGTACGRPYPLSERFLGDMRQLAQTFAGTAQGPRLYVTLFTEFQTYACKDNAWNADAQSNAYFRALKDRYSEALAVFHQNAPNANVSLGWGGWQTRFDDPKTGAGRSMFQYFSDVMRASDFQSFQAMQSDSNIADVRAMTRVLGTYGPVMLAHYKPDNSSASTFDTDMRAMLTDSYLADVAAAGLFAWSFMDSKNLDAAPTTFQFVKNAVIRYGSAAK